MGQLGHVLRHVTFPHEFILLFLEFTFLRKGIRRNQYLKKLSRLVNYTGILMKNNTQILFFLTLPLILYLGMIILCTLGRFDTNKTSSKCKFMQ